MMKRILLLDPWSTGHHPMYMRMMTQALLESGHRVLSICPGEVGVREWVAQKCPDLIQHLEVFGADAPPISSFPHRILRRTLSGLKAWRHAGRCVREALKASSFRNADLVFILWLDDYLVPLIKGKVVDRLFPWAWSGLYFNPTACRRPPAEPAQFADISWPRRLVHALLPKAIRLRIGDFFRWAYSPLGPIFAERCICLAVLDEGAAEGLDTVVPKAVMVFPDFTDESSPDFDWPVVRHLRAQAAGRKIVGLIGEQSERKGILTLLEVASRTVNEDLFYVFAGTPYFSEEWKASQPLLRTPPPNCFLHFARIPDEPRFNALIASCDVLFAAYRNFPHSSNILAKAAISRKLVVVSEGFCMAERVRRYRLGTCIPQEDAAACAQALCAMLEGSTYERYRAEADFEGYARLHSREQLGSRLREMVNLIPAP